MKKYLSLILFILTVGFFYNSTLNANPSNEGNPVKNDSEAKVIQKLKTTAKVSKSNKLADIPSTAQEYILLGESVFNEEGNNIYLSGGDTISYSVYMDFNESKGTVTLYNLFRDFLDIELLPVTMNWDTKGNRLSVDTPEEFISEEDCVYMGEEDSNDEKNRIYSLQAGNPYGIGYWQFVPEFVMDIASDGSVITPESGFALTLDAYSSVFKYYYPYSYVDALYDIKFYKRTQGISIYGDKENIDFGETFIDTSTQRKFRVVNAGTEQADFVISSTDPCFEPNIVSGYISPGEFVDILVTFNPDKAGKFEGKLIIETETSSASVSLFGEGRESLDYKAIVTSGYEYMEFATCNDYPFIISDQYTGFPVAVSTNQGQGRTISWLEIEINVPEEKRGELSWKGFFNPRWSVYDAFWITDNGKQVYETPSDDQYVIPMESVIAMTPGDHTLRFAYQKGTMVDPFDVELGEDYAYIYDLNLSINDYLPYSASLNKDSYHFGNLYKGENETLHINRENVVSLKNTGYEDLEIIEIKGEGGFNAKTSANIIKPENNCELSISLSYKEFGEVEGKIIISTNAGDFTVNCSANILPIPDYNQIVKQGDFFFQVGNNPFVVIDGYAVNDNTIEVSGAETISEFTANFNIPEGKAGLLTWNGFYDCGDGDMAMIMVDQDPYGMAIFRDGLGDAGPYKMLPFQCWLESGSHMISFGYLHTNDSQWQGTNSFAISELSLEIKDQIPALVYWNETPLEFTPVYAGKYDKRSIRVFNMGKENLALEDVTASEGFSTQYNLEMNSDVPQYMALGFEASFQPETPGNYDGNILVKTSVGEIEIPVSGVALDPSLIIYEEDFENGLEGWEILDVNGDSKTWEESGGTFAHTGEGCLIFNSFFTRVDSEDYIVSPEINIPEEGASLSYFRRYSTNNDLQTYDVRAGEGQDPTKFEILYGDLDMSDSYEEIILSLEAFKGKTIRICFANFTSADASNVLVIDDLVVLANENAVTQSIVDDDVIERSFFTLDGLRISNPTQGIYLVRDQLKNGTFKIQKIIIR